MVQKAIIEGYSDDQFPFQVFKVYNREDLEPEFFAFAISAEQGFDLAKEYQDKLDYYALEARWKVLDVESGEFVIKTAIAESIEASAAVEGGENGSN